MQSLEVDNQAVRSEEILVMDLADQSTLQKKLPQSTDRKKRRRRGKKRRSGKMNDSGIREGKRYSPKAPENYTQYLLEDQKNSSLDVNANTDLCLSSFLKAQFESDFSEARATELAQKSKPELAAIICELENKRSRLMRHHCYCSECNASSLPVEGECEVEDKSFNTSSSDSDVDICDDWTATLGAQLLALEKENARLKKEKERSATISALH